MNECFSEYPDESEAVVVEVSEIAEDALGALLIAVVTVPNPKVNLGAAVVAAG